MTATAARASSTDLPDSVAHDIVNEWKESILVLDQKRKVTFANQSFCEWVGTPWKEVEGRLLEDMVQSREVSDFLHEVQAGSAVRSMQASCKIAGLGTRTLQVQANLLLNARRKAILVGIHDVTNQKLGSSALSARAEAAEISEMRQRKEADLLRSITESSAEGIFVIDGKKQCVLWNPACERMLGAKPNSIPFKEWTKEFGFYLPDKVTPFAGKDLPITRALAGESWDEVEMWLVSKRCPEGMWISMSCRPLTGGQDGAVATFRDITFAKNAKQALEKQAEEISRSNRELEQFAYVASHDLQEPLRMVSSYVQLLARRYKGKLDSEADEFIGFAIDGAKRMSQLINDLLGYSRVGRGDVREQLVSCESVLEKVLFSLTQKNEAAGAVVTHDPLPEIQANELQITQIFQNLIDNAVKFRKDEPPRVHISAHQENGNWVFSVADNGIGIEEEYRDRIFVIFQRLNPREDYPGTGIGLSVCKRIIEKRDGKIWVESNSGSGTVVNFTWP